MIDDGYKELVLPPGAWKAVFHGDFSFSIVADHRDGDEENVLALRWKYDRNGEAFFEALALLDSGPRWLYIGKPTNSIHPVRCHVDLVPA